MDRVLYSILVLFLICSCAGTNNIHSAVKKQNLEEIKTYVEQGDIELTDSNGFTPLILASYYDHPPIVKYLCDNGADVDKGDNKGWTALMYASYYNFYDIAKILLDNNASVNKKNSEGHTALYYANQYKYEDIVKLLKEKGAESH
jgi:ankyrin repeat protein